eukprot:g29619.t1
MFAISYPRPTGFFQEKNKALGFAGTCDRGKSGFISPPTGLWWLFLKGGILYSLAYGGTNYIQAGRNFGTGCVILVPQQNPPPHVKRWGVEAVLGLSSSTCLLYSPKPSPRWTSLLLLLGVARGSPAVPLSGSGALLRTLEANFLCLTASLLAVPLRGPGKKS